MTVMNKNGLLLVFELARAPNSPNTLLVTSTAANSTPAPITDFMLQVAVPKVR